MLTPKVKEALQAELEHLRIRREQMVASIDERIRALEEVLRPSTELAFSGDVAALRDGSSAHPRPAKGPLAGRGLRESIRIVLTNYPTGLVPADIATRLEEMGYTAGGRLSISKRVYGELYRMRQKGLVSQRGRRYVVNA